MGIISSMINSFLKRPSHSNLPIALLHEMLLIVWSSRRLSRETQTFCTPKKSLKTLSAQAFFWSYSLDMREQFFLFKSYLFALNIKFVIRLTAVKQVGDLSHTTRSHSSSMQRRYWNGFHQSIAQTSSLRIQFNWNARAALNILNSK